MKVVRQLAKAFLNCAVCLVIGVTGCERTEESPRKSAGEREDDAGTLVICSYGGSFQEAQRQALFEPFSKATGIDVREASYGGEYGRILAMVESGTVLWDVVDVETSVVYRGAQDGVLERLADLEVPKHSLDSAAIHY